MDFMKTTNLAKTLEMPYVYSGTISSANHSAPRWVDESGKYEGKYKAILSLSNGVPPRR